MKKSDFKKYIDEIIINELSGMLTNTAKQTRRNAIQAEIKDLQQQLKDKQLEFSQIR